MMKGSEDPVRYICSVCGYVYDEAKEKIPWAELPEDWKCPLCGAAKSDFVPEGQASGSAEAAAPAAETELKPLTAAEVSALCSNLAKGCEKQYKAELAEAFTGLAAWFGGQERTVTDASFEKLLDKHELVIGFEAVGSLSTAFIAAVPHHFLLQEFLDQYSERHFLKEDGSIDMTTINQSITPLFEKYGLKSDEDR